MFDLIAFDADDTLWHNETLYTEAQDRLKGLLSSYADAASVEQALYEKEMGNLGHYGYGIKSFTLSMIETAIELTSGEITGIEIRQIIGFGKTMLAAEVQLFQHAEETVRTLGRSHTLMLLTKGDLLDQHTKLARSGLTDCFRHVEVVSDKRPETYAALLKKHGVAPQRFLMVGNSLKSDILPVLALGGHAVYVPYHLTWVHEHADAPPADRDGYHELAHLGQLPALLDRLDHRGTDLEAS